MRKACKAEFKFDERSLERLPSAGICRPTNVQDSGAVASNYYDAIKELVGLLGICAQCASNAMWNYCGGYISLGTECVRYCLNGHKELRLAGDNGLLPGTNVHTSGPETAKRGECNTGHGAIEDCPVHRTAAAVILGKLGGASKSPAKQRASKKNGKLGGRPRKAQQPQEKA